MSSAKKKPKKRAAKEVSRSRATARTWPRSDVAEVSSEPRTRKPIASAKPAAKKSRPSRSELQRRDLEYLPAPWKIAIADVIASTGSHYVRSGLQDPRQHPRAINIPLAAITREVHESIDEAREGFRETFDEARHESECTCRHQAILAVISDRIARRTRRTWDEMMKINCQQLTRFLSQRS